MDRLKDVADTLDGEAKDDAEDDVARQERLIMGKIFDIGMTGDEFARVVTEGMVYVQTVLAEMIEDYNTEESPDLDRNAYCKEVLKDYDFLVYVMSFNDIYYGKDGSAVAANGKPVRHPLRILLRLQQRRGTLSVRILKTADLFAPG